MSPPDLEMTRSHQSSHSPMMTPCRVTYKKKINISPTFCMKEKEVNTQLLQATFEPVVDVWCTHCKGDRNTYVVKELSPLGIIVFIILCILFPPFCALVYFIDRFNCHSHHCSTCRNVLWSNIKNKKWQKVNLIEISQNFPLVEKDD